MATKWEYGVVAFLDILGFSSFIEADASAAAPTHLERLVACLDEVRKSTPDALDLRSFSDSIVVSGPMTLETVEDVVRSVVVLQRIFARNRVLVRGGIAFGKHYISRDSLYSEALIKAYDLERKDARFPRILLDKDLFDWFSNDMRLTKELRDKLRVLLLRDRDGKIFLNYLDKELLPYHLDLLTDYEMSIDSASILEKIQWLASYHNYVAGTLGLDMKVSGPLIAEFLAVP